MIKIDFTKPGGYRLKQDTFGKMQSAYELILKTFIKFCGISDAGNFIISGCKVVGPNIEPGIMFIDGELCEFTGAAGTEHSLIKKNVVMSTLVFKNGTNPQVFRATSAIIDPAGVELADFERIYPVFDENYTHTDFNFTLALLNKLNGIEAGAQVNVNADWSETNPLAPGFIVGKPMFLDVLAQKTFLIGDFGTSSSMYDEIVTVSFPDVGTSDYRVIYSLESLGNWDVDNDTISVIRNKTSSSFEICLREATSGFSMIQNLRLQYILIRITP